MNTHETVEGYTATPLDSQDSRDRRDRWVWRVLDAVFLITLFIALALGASDYARADEWTKADTARQWAFTAILAADAVTTADIRNHSDVTEGNPLTRWAIGSDPEPEATAAYFAVAAGLHYAVSRALPSKYRATWQTVSIVVNGAIVANNVRLGLRWGF